MVLQKIEIDIIFPIISDAIQIMCVFASISVYFNTIKRYKCKTTHLYKTKYLVCAFQRNALPKDGGGIAVIYSNAPPTLHYELHIKLAILTVEK